MNTLRRRTYGNKNYTLIGVYILATDGSLISASAWATANKTANAIYVNDGTNKVLMALGYIISHVTATDLGGKTYFTTEESAYTDLNGKEGTSLMATSVDVTNYTFPNGKTGYIPSLGEWKLIIDNYTEVLTALNACGGSAIPGTLYGVYANFISSTWYNTENIWAIYYSITYGIIKSEIASRLSTNPYLYIRPFLSFNNT